jgi:hypothetical protein
MLAPKREFGCIIGPFSRIIISSFSNEQQSPKRICIVRTEMVMWHSFYRPMEPNASTSLVRLAAGRPAAFLALQLFVTFRCLHHRAEDS